MDFIKNAMGGGSGNNNNAQGVQGAQGAQKTSSGGGFTDKLNNMAGGGARGEQNEDALDKGIDYIQEHVLGQGSQTNESAVEQMKDEKIADFIRNQYKSTTGSEFPVKDKERKFGM
ncbi:unnamed protein product [Parascedosporium putredinis]|uniref:DNA damage-responsive protein 48 n=1 Tax=Parascedosporium putredinis TaxID=1442378 RepID=A0A9P1GW15_9PEZI|nr:unnamed protein product [Parascedosporium putredinis]CAI7988081.1 unnamed protein product [Parascedosporium putredinis]